MSEVPETLIAHGRIEPRLRQSSKIRGMTASGWTMLLPALVFLGIFVFIPIIYVVYLSMYKSNLLLPHPAFVGIQNYIGLLHDPTFVQAFWNSVILGVGMLIISLPLGILFAALLNMKLRGTRIYRTILFSPYVIPLVGSGLVFTLLFNTENGLVNHILGLFGAKPIDWLGQSHTALLSVVIISVWQYVGYYMLIFLAGLQNVPQSQLEACRVDGGSRWSSFVHVTLPSITPSIFFAIVICIIQSFQTFDQIYVMTGGGPDGASSTLAYYIYQEGFQMFNMGPSSAASVVLLVLLAGLSLIQIRLSNRWVVDAE